VSARDSYLFDQASWTVQATTKSNRSFYDDRNQPSTLSGMAQVLNATRSRRLVVWGKMIRYSLRQVRRPFLGMYEC